MNMLFVVSDAAAAKFAGFEGADRAGRPGLRAWWPSRGIDELTARPLELVVISSEALQTLSSETLAILKISQAVFGDRAMWVEF